MTLKIKANRINRINELSFLLESILNVECLTIIDFDFESVFTLQTDHLLATIKLCDKLSIILLQTTFWENVSSILC